MEKATHILLEDFPLEAANPMLKWRKGKFAFCETVRAYTITNFKTKRW